jgi:manganese/zinc/iron transport system permease protein
MLAYNTLIVVLGAMLLGGTSGAMGCFAILRRRALLGDVIAHSALPGIALAFWITQSKSLPILLVGALTTSLLGVWALSIIRQHTRTKEDTAMALVLTVLFGAGISLSRYVQNAILEGSQAGLDTYIFGKTAGIVLSDVYLLMVVSFLVLLYACLSIKEFRLVIFDPNYASTIGWKVVWLDFSIMSLIALIVVVGLPMVGIVMMAAMVLIPAVTARFWTNNFSAMMFLAIIAGMVSACAGVLISGNLEKMPTGPTIILCAGTLFILSALLAPSRGILAYWIRQQKFHFEWHCRNLLRELESTPGLSTEQCYKILESQNLNYPRITIIRALRIGWIYQGQNGVLSVTESGRSWLDKTIKQELLTEG